MLFYRMLERIQEGICIDTSKNIKGRICGAFMRCLQIQMEFIFHYMTEGNPIQVKTEGTV